MPGNARLIAAGLLLTGYAAAGTTHLPKSIPVACK